MDINQILYSPSGKPRIAIFSIAHLNDTERMFFVSLLLTQMVSWMRTQSGTTSLRALLYMDEVFGFFPPTQNPPSKTPMLTMLKQARAYGLGVVLATQNPVDLDYKGLGNTGTWFIGRLQTDRDMARVLDGLEGAAANSQGGFNRQKMEQTISGLGNRVFLMNNVHDDGPEIFETRWALSYLRGPLTRTQIKTLMDPVKDANLSDTSQNSPTKAKSQKARKDAQAANTHPPVIPSEIAQYFVPIRSSQPEDSTLIYEPRLLASADVHFLDGRRKIDESRGLIVLVPLTHNATPVEWDDVTSTELLPDDLESTQEDEGVFGELPAPAYQAKNYKKWQKDFVTWVYRHHTLAIWKNPALKITSDSGESERDFRLRVQQLTRETRDAKTEKLRKKYTTKMGRLEDRIRKAEQAVEREEEQAKQQKFQTVISLGATVLSAFLGRKAVSRSSMGKAATTIRGISRSRKESQDIDRAEDNVEALKQQLADLETEFTQEAEDLASQLQDQSETLETVKIRPKKSNITVELLGLGWVPHWQDSQGQQTPAWE